MTVWRSCVEGDGDTPNLTMGYRRQRQMGIRDRLLPPPQAASRPAAPTAPVTFRKSRREIALLIFSPPNCKTQNSQGAIADPLVYNYDNKKLREKKDANCGLKGKNAHILLY